LTLVCARPHNLVTSESEWIPAIYWIRSGVVDTYQIYDGTDELGIVGTAAPGPFAQEGRCWRMVYENPVGHGGHCMEPVAWVGRWKFLDGWTKVEQQADELIGARGTPLARGYLDHGDPRSVT